MLYQKSRTSFLLPFWQVATSNHLFTDNTSYADLPCMNCLRVEMGERACYSGIFYYYIFMYININVTSASRNWLVCRRRKIRLIEGSAKCRHLKKITSKGTLRQVFICLRPKIPYRPPPPLHAVSVYTVYLFTQGRGVGGWRVEPEGRLEGQQFTKLVRKYQHGLLYFQSINSDKHLPQRPFTGKFF